MDTELKRANKLVKRFDENLMARRSMDGVLQVCQLVREWHPVEMDALIVHYPVDVPHLVFCCTDNWAATGKPVSWGYLPLYQKLNEIRLDRRKEMLAEMELNNQKARESKDRDLKNQIESIAIETRDIFKKTFSDTNTASMDKTKDVRRKQDRSIRWR